MAISTFWMRQELGMGSKMVFEKENLVVKILQPLKTKTSEQSAQN